MKRKCGHTRQSNPDTTARPMRHVSDTKKLLSATIMAASSYGGKTLRGPLLLMERTMSQCVPIWPAKPMSRGGRPLHNYRHTGESRYPGAMHEGRQLSSVPSELRRDGTCDCTPATNATTLRHNGRMPPIPRYKHRAVNATVAAGTHPGPTVAVASRRQLPQHSQS